MPTSKDFPIKTAYFSGPRPYRVTEHELDTDQ
jgi:hypothetical protein